MRQIGQVSERWAHLATQATWKSCPQARAATAVWASTSSKQTAQTKLSSERRERREKMCTRIGNKEGNEEKFSKWMESYQLDRYPGGRDRRTKSELSCLLLSRFFWGGEEGVASGLSPIFRSSVSLSMFLSLYSRSTPRSPRTTSLPQLSSFPSTNICSGAISRMLSCPVSVSAVCPIRCCRKRRRICRRSHNLNSSGLTSK